MNETFRVYASWERQIRQTYGGLSASEFWWFTERMLVALAAGRP